MTTEFVFSNKFYGRIKGGINASTVTIELYPGYIYGYTSWQALKNTQLTIIDQNKNVEVVTVTAINFSNNRLTVSRETGAREWPDGTIITNRMTSDSLNQFIQKESFREIAFNPNGILSAAYPGEKVFQGGSFNLWWKNVTGTVWQRIAGIIPKITSVTWEVISPSDLNGYDWRSVAYNISANEFLAVSYGSGVIAKTTYGNVWTVEASATLPSNCNNTIWCDSIGLYITSSAGDLWSSPDGVTWTQRYNFTNGFANCLSLKWYEDKGIIIAVCSDGLGTNWILTSSNGVDFTAVYSTAALTLRDTEYIESLDRFICVAYNTTHLYSDDDGATWSTRTVNLNVNYLRVANSGSLLVAITGTGGIYTSTDGVTWTSRTPATSTGFDRIIWADGIFLILSDNTSVVSTQYSINGTDWNNADIDSSSWRDFAFSELNRIFVAVASSGTDRAARGS